MIQHKSNHRKRLKRYNIPNHAHELTFSCYQKRPYLKDPAICEIFMQELDHARQRFSIKIWAYVLMPDHVHLLLLPENEVYNISVILQHIKGKTATKYRQSVLKSDPERFDNYCVAVSGKKMFRIWQPGGGFDRNLWNAEAIHAAVNYIEWNPVSAGLVQRPEDWMWSSAWARLNHTGLDSDLSELPMWMK